MFGTRTVRPEIRYAIPYLIQNPGVEILQFSTSKNQTLVEQVQRGRLDINRNLVLRDRATGRKTVWGVSGKLWGVRNPGEMGCFLEHPKLGVLCEHSGGWGDWTISGTPNSAFRPHDPTRSMLHCWASWEDAQAAIRQQAENVKKYGSDRSMRFAVKLQPYLEECLPLPVAIWWAHWGCPATKDYYPLPVPDAFA